MASPRSLLALALAVLLALAASQWLQGRGERGTAEALAGLAGPGDIRMLSSEVCPYCEAARRWMGANGVRFDECFIERDAQCKAVYEATQARGTPTLLVRGQVQLGFDARRVLAALRSPPPG